MWWCKEDKCQKTYHHSIIYGPKCTFSWSMDTISGLLSCSKFSIPSLKKTLLKKLVMSTCFSFIFLKYIMAQLKQLYVSVCLRLHLPNIKTQYYWMIFTMFLHKKNTELREGLQSLEHDCTYRLIYSVRFYTQIWEEIIQENIQHRSLSRHTDAESTN